jgi:colanic acid/amylovoran biosynthesis glycosyltransferase
MSDSRIIALCIVQPNAATVSETFIQAHAAHLPAQVTVVHGDPPRIGGRALLDPSWVARIARKARRRLTGRRPEQDRTEAYRRAFREVRPDAVLAEYGTVGVQVLEACREFGVPLTVHFHGFDAGVHAVLAAHRRSYPDLFHGAAAIIAVSRAMQQRLRGLGAPPGKLHLNPYGVDCGRFGGAAPAEAAPVFLGVGRLVPKKAPHLTLRAFAEVHRHHPEARLRLIGDGPLRDDCRRLARDLGIVAAVAFLGARPHAAVAEEMRRARAFVLHSVVAPSGDREGTPVSILEAGASGLPVVATRHEGIPDVVVEGETGLLVDERDIEAMARHMLRLAREPALAGAMGRAARQHIETNFALDVRIGHLWSILQSTMMRADPPPPSSEATPRGQG